MLSYDWNYTANLKKDEPKCTVDLKWDQTINNNVYASIFHKYLFIPKLKK